MTNWSTFSSGSGMRVTEWNYNAQRGWLESKRYPDLTTGLPTTLGPDYTYWPGGRLKERIWARGNPRLTTSYSYNEAGELAGVNYSDNTPDVSYVYNRLGRQQTITQSTSPAATVTGFSYNDAGLVLSEQYTQGVLSGLAVTNGYDQFLRRTNVVAHQGGTILSRTTNSFDAAGRLHTVGNGSVSATYSYVVNSPLVGQITFQQGSTPRMTTSKTYDSLNRLTEISSVPSASSAVTFGYVYNSANQRTRRDEVDASHWQYAYDALGQVISGKKYWSDGTPVAGQQFEYAFDDIGNRTQTKDGGDQSGASLRASIYSPNRLNQYTSRTVPGYVDSIGEARSDATVTLWTADGSYAATSRKGDYFRGELPVNNATGAVWLTFTNLAVLNNGSNPDIITNINASQFVAKTPQLFYHDQDGNLTNDGHWIYTWDGENRLVRMDTLNTNPAVGPQLWLEFEYDWRGRRIGKKVGQAGSGTATNTLRFIYDNWNLLATLNSSK